MRLYHNRGVERFRVQLLGADKVVERYQFTEMYPKRDQTHLVDYVDARDHTTGYSIGYFCVAHRRTKYTS